MEFQEKLDAIWGRISSEKFLANRGTANEVRYYIFDYDGSNELYVREKIASLKRQNNPENDGFVICEFDLYELVMRFIEDKGYIEKCEKFEQTKGHEHLKTAIMKMLRGTGKDSLIVNEIVENTPSNAVVFLTGVGKAYPFVSANNILNTLHQILDYVPVVMFYPGTWDGRQLMLLNSINDGKYYRAFPLV